MQFPAFCPARTTYSSLVRRGRYLWRSRRSRSMAFHRLSGVFVHSLAISSPLVSSSIGFSSLARKTPNVAFYYIRVTLRARYLFLIYPARSRFSQFHSRIIPHPLANTCCYPAQKKFDCPIKFQLSPRTLRFDPMGISVLWKRRHPDTVIPSLLKITVLFLYT